MYILANSQLHRKPILIYNTAANLAEWTENLRAILKLPSVGIRQENHYIISFQVNLLQLITRNSNIQNIVLLKLRHCVSNKSEAHYIHFH